MCFLPKKFIFFLIYLQIASSAHLALLCSWVSESPPLQVRAKNEIAGHLIIKKFIKISQFHMIKICKKINKNKKIQGSYTTAHVLQQGRWNHLHHYWLWITLSPKQACHLRLINYYSPLGFEHTRNFLTSWQEPCLLNSAEFSAQRNGSVKLCECRPTTFRSVKLHLLGDRKWGAQWGKARTIIVLVGAVSTQPRAEFHWTQITGNHK